MSTHDYGSATYWDERYSKNDSTYDWYLNYDDLRPVLTKYVSKRGHVLHVGCGTSPLTVDMEKDGYQHTLAVDRSAPAIEYMKLRYPRQDWRVVDCLHMPYHDGTFDAVIDKGMMDAILCGSSSQSLVQQMLIEVARVLRRGGVFILSTTGNPNSRLGYLTTKGLPWIGHITYEMIKKKYQSSDDFSYVFIMTKY